ncbi:Uncharacterised protein [Serratia plymuthica]|nr:Uncharacterised protein [Serratia plymuthica]
MIVNPYYIILFLFSEKKSNVRHEYLNNFLID